ncbi:phosphoglycerol transferase MdoB-like AlkP superfamily enzyme [Arcticibacter tournemirensis]|uniref:LTA synthase family protein n=2 Tax=Arcticibacter tournemirensis TaxID=699437 RepID=A0A5M9GKH7_9SPHI|nr:LTA synthase family protein [Arcticibacter tournemirensis]TQM52426.1 phosphoglycerol transferase MdoB-like AlkP superfamily enzyme [Arcticibacter tournemirensis]
MSFLIREGFLSVCLLQSQLITMLKNIFVLLRYFTFWLLFFLLERCVFLLYYIHRLKGVSFYEFIQVYFYGAWMDASMAGYICAIPALLFVIVWLFGIKKFPITIVKIYTWLLVGLFSFLTVVNFNIYREWGTKINFRALEFAFGSPAEAFSSSESSPVFLSLFIFAVLTSAGIFLSRLIIEYRIFRGGNFAIRLLLSVLMLGFNFLAIRGGWQLSPMNESMAYFSLKPLLNYAAVNTEWSLVHDILNNKYNNSNPFKYYSPSEAKSIVKGLYLKPNTATTDVLTTRTPNVVLIIMESFTGNVVESLDGEKGVAPQTEKLISEGLFFNHIYASGGRTDKGVVAVLSAFPAQGRRSIMKENSKQVKIPALSQSFAGKGYSTSFFYGGESRFFNMRSYLLSHNYQKIVDKSDFDPKDMNSKWGAYDGAVYTRMLSDLKTAQAPFFSTMLTLTNHEPFELPSTPRFKGEEIENKFRSTAYYADSCVGAFIREAKKQSWYKNTLFIIVADHGHYLPRTNLEIFDPQRYRIPLLFFGEVIKPEFRGVKIEKAGSQNDLAATLLNQVAIKSDAYTWSKDLLNPGVAGFAFFNWEHGLGFVSPQQAISYDIVGDNIVFRQDSANTSSDKLLLKYGKACMQHVYQQYVDY